MKNITKYNDYEMINESLPSNFFEYGYYDMANGQRDGVIDFLKENDIKYTFDSYRNYIEVETYSTKELIDKMTECDFVKMDIRYVEEEPDDCLLLRAPKPNVPDGAYM